jgi:tetratricopeptide (TPR) repeat protein
MLSQLVLAVSLLGQSSPAAPTAPQPTSDRLGQAYQLFLEGRELEERNDLDGAVAAYQRATELFPDSADLHAELAMMFARRGEGQASLREADAAIALDPTHRGARRIRGLVRANLAANVSGQSQAADLVAAAIEDLEIVVADRLVDPTAGLTLGRLYVQAGRYQQAIERLRIFLLDRPAYPEALLLLAEAYEETHQFATAIEALQQVTAALPDQARVWTRLGELQERAGQWQAAAGTWAHLVERNPRNLSYRIRQATALVNAGDVAGGRAALREITEQEPEDVRAWYLLSQVERRAGDAAAAEAAARRIAEIDADDPRGPLALAEARAARGDFRGVVDVLEPLVRDPNEASVSGGSFARMVGQLAAALDEIGDQDRAVAVLEQARLRDAGNIDLLFSLGAAYERARRFDQAEQAFRQVIVREPTHAEALNYLGYMFAERGTKLDEAVDLITRALAIEPDNPSFLDSLGWAYVKQAKLDAAREPLQRAAQARPQTSVIQDHLAELYFQLQLYQEAAGVWDRALAGDRAGIDVSAVTRKRDRARALAGRQ